MVKIPVIKTATVRVVQKHELNVNDYILYMNWRCIVTCIQMTPLGPTVTFHPVFDKNLTEETDFLNYYVIEEYTEEFVEV